MGSVVISVEASLGWAHHPNGEGTSNERYRNARHAWRRASYLFDRHKVEATWLVAGHLFAPDCRGRRSDVDEQAGRADGPEPTDRAGTDAGGPGDRGASGTPSGERPERARTRGTSERERAGVHPDHPLDSSWFPCDGDLGERASSVWTAPDLVASLRQSRADHEIGCQPFSRVDFGDEVTNQRLAAAEVRASIDAAADLGIDDAELKSFAFPGDHVGHRNVLAAYGFEGYRAPGPGWPVSGRLASLGTLLKVLGGAPPPLVEPETDDYGLVAVPTSTSLFPLAGRARSVTRSGPGDPVASTVKRGVDRTVENDGVLHLALRPLDLRTETDFERLDSVLAHVDECRRERGLFVETLGEVARRVRDHAVTSPSAIK